MEPGHGLLATQLAFLLRRNKRRLALGALVLAAAGGYVATAQVAAAKRQRQRKAKSS